MVFGLEHGRIMKIKKLKHCWFSDRVVFEAHEREVTHFDRTSGYPAFPTVKYKMECVVEIGERIELRMPKFMQLKEGDEVCLSRIVNKCIDRDIDKFFTIRKREKDTKQND